MEGNCTSAPKSIRNKGYGSYKSLFFLYIPLSRFEHDSSSRGFEGERTGGVHRVMQKLGEKLVTRVSRFLKCTINDVTASRLDRRAGCISQSGLWRKERLAI